MSKPNNSPPPYARVHSFATLVDKLWGDYIKPYRFSLVLAIFFMVIEGSTFGVISYILRPMFDTLFLAENQDTLWLVCTAVFSIFLLRSFCSITQKVLITKITAHSVADIQNDLLRHIIGLDGQFFNTHAPGYLISRIRNDTAVILNVWNLILRGIWRDSIAVVSLLVVMISIDWLWTVLVLFGVPMLVWPNIILQRYIRRKVGQFHDLSAFLSNRLDEIFHAIKTIKLNRLEQYQCTQFKTTMDQSVLAQIKSTLAQATMPSLIDLIIGFGLVLVIIFSAQDIISGDKTVGQFVSFFSAIGLSIDPLRRLSSIPGAWQSMAASLDRVFTLLDTEQTQRQSPALPIAQSAVHAMYVKPPCIVFDNVTVIYHETPVLRNVSFVAKAGVTTAFVGTSGAGKSTLFNVLGRLVDVNAGRVTIDGHSIYDFDVHCLRSLFSVVLQETLLFDETLQENILLSKSEQGLSVKEHALFKQALQQAHINDFLPTLAHGLATRVGPRGGILSGGQRQRVALARAIFQRAPILLLDEPTASLDAQTESIIQQVLDTLPHLPTTLTIAHRLPTLRSVDKIVVLDRGRVVEQGTHNALLAQDDSVYAHLYALYQRTEQP